MAAAKKTVKNAPAKKAKDVYAWSVDEDIGIIRYSSVADTEASILQDMDSDDVVSIWKLVKEVKVTRALKETS